MSIIKEYYNNITLESTYKAFQQTGRRLIIEHGKVTGIEVTIE